MCPANKSRNNSNLKHCVSQTRCASNQLFSLAREPLQRRPSTRRCRAVPGLVPTGPRALPAATRSSQVCARIQEMGADSIPLDFGGQVFFPTSTGSNSSAAATGRCHLTGQGAHVSYVSEALGYVGTDTGTVHFRLAPLSKLNPPAKASVCHCGRAFSPSSSPLPHSFVAVRMPSV